MATYTPDIAQLERSSEADVQLTLILLNVIFQSALHSKGERVQNPKLW